MVIIYFTIISQGIAAISGEKRLVGLRILIDHLQTVAAYENCRFSQIMDKRILMVRTTMLQTGLHLLQIGHRDLVSLADDHIYTAHFISGVYTFFIISTEVGQSTLITFRLSGQANIASMQNKPVVSDCDIFPGDVFNQLIFYR